MKEYYIYIMTNIPFGTLYIGVTNDLVRRVYEHKSGFMEGFTKRYGLTSLVYYESCGDINAAIQREKQLKKWNRQLKVEKISGINPDWIDLYNFITGLDSRSGRE